MDTRRYRVIRNPDTEKWELQHEDTGEVLKIFRTRDQALGRRVVERTIGNAGVVTVYRLDGTVSKVLEYPVRVRR
ncbi:hypothetical protein [Asticcacaulis sp. 201]|uniref:hypothetical protein n=1 Tax=Asticcacaulis sp. 201 TaxID=3028787 RepID=UPI0029164F72|nr:hypothetical protein [Asticcacaulis sp. 201]MDV6330025.1 hypothetical protein [Asticcacaulis sp. 201]